MRVLGIDEAGRGCVLGPLVVTGFVCEDPDDATLRAAGAGDSKAMTAKRRDAARDQLAALGDAHIERITPAEIDAGNLNQLEEEAIRRIVRAARPDVVILDALGHPSTLAAVLARLRPAAPDADWQMAPKADATFAVVGAASVFAKTTRDAALADAQLGQAPFGSGYPSDPKTRGWLQAWAATGAPWPDFVRTRWQTVVDLSAPRLV